jgi:Phage portal protein
MLKALLGKIFPTGDAETQEAVHLLAEHLESLDKSEQLEALEKALPHAEAAAAKPKGHYVEPSGVANVRMMEQVDLKAETRAGLDYGQLEAMSHVPLIAAIIQTRVNQMAEFSVAERDGINIGFQIRLRDHTQVPNEGDLKRINEIYDFMETCGDPRIGLGGSFESFLRMLTTDSLIYDQACFEVIRNKRGDVAAFQVVDATTIRRARPTDKERKQGYRDPDSVHYVQIIGDKVTAEFKFDDLCFGVRRPRSILAARGYGHPELMECVSLVTHLLNTEAYNAANFTSGVNVNGILAVKTRMNPSLFRQFRKEFYAMLNGSGNSRKTPLIQLSPDDNEGIQAVNLGASNREMEFQAWHAHLMKAICSVFQVDPFELGYKFGTEGQRNTLNESSGITRLGMSKDKGLRPLLRNVEMWLNRFVVRALDPRFELRFTGLDSVSPREQLDRDRLKVSTYMTLNELRSSFDMPPVDGGDMILNDVYLKALQLRSIGLEPNEPVTAINAPPKPEDLPGGEKPEASEDSKGEEEHKDNKEDDEEDTKSDVERQIREDLNKPARKIKFNEEP